MYGFRNKARAVGAEYVADTVVDIGRTGGRVTSVTLASGQVIGAGPIVNTSGPRAALTARMAGLEIPVEPRKRSLCVFDCARTSEGNATVNQGRLPLMIAPSGDFSRPEGKMFLSGCAPVDDKTANWDDVDPTCSGFEDIIRPTLVERSEAFEAIKVVNQWAEHYASNTLDHNMVIGTYPEVGNFVFTNGFSRHGLQQGQATGPGVSELIIYDGSRTLDMSEVGYERIIAGRPFMERAVI